MRVASVAIALLLGLPVAAMASEQPLGSPAASPDGGASQELPDAQSAPEPGVSAGDEQTSDAGEPGDEDAGGRASRGEVAAAANASRLTRGSPGDVAAGDPPVAQEHSDDAAPADSQRPSDADYEDAAAANERADYEDAAAAGECAGDEQASGAGECGDDASDEEATPAAPHAKGSVAVPPALRQRAAALPWRADRDARRSTPDRTDVRSSGVAHVGSTPSHTRSLSRFASAQRGASAATLATPVTTAPTAAVTAPRGSARAPSKPNEHGHARATTRQQTAPVPPLPRRSAATTTTATVASGSAGDALGASPVTGALVGWALATGAIWFMLRERAHRMRSLLWAAPLERPG